MKKLGAVLLVALLSACAKPSDGPTAGNIRSATFPRTNEKIPVIELANAPAATVSAGSLQGASGPGLTALRNTGYNAQRLRRGDVIDITVLDTGEDGLFSPTQSKTLNLGRFTVDQSGSVNIPFVGKQRVVDSTPEGLQSQVVAGLKGSAVNPQAVVTVVDKPTSAVMLSGAVKNPGKITLTARQERVLDALNQAGGPTVAPGAATVTVVRGSHRASAPLDRVMREDRQNIRLSPDDQIMIDGDAASYTALGAFKSAGEFQFEAGKLTLAQAVGRAGGLLDDRADARNVYVFRNEIIQVPSATAPGAKGPVATATTMRPVIYHVNMRDASSIALMQLFQMQKGDVLYASNAPLVDSAKLLTVFQKSVPTAAAPLPGSGN
ncbi:MULTISPECIES: polysaccharide biosynthesis/export family protein [Agrobacterium]|jgi:polysaccharide export outer membrane protein|uniref:polysaccharide biosynthesis/export family protein n=1 Tax=Agrobacterium TaxID=357 RepID=UPI000DD0A0EC|nr:MULTISPECIES: polysaccharide biosynthesis/export family protein [Agrobacterium]MBB4409288.1 polysaccharide export outer membrane protein [Agrobacterium radiobacter]MBB4454768.1 polysaccharide export outer membrane protein [Agrobacterium radiobacter]MBP2535729.1 polysaccharide export outer membrane protein [Agrobacterium tumefaciens]MDP9789528.1 polysaccharide export outer membrane protein [Agrobacterium tumefaciens]MDP9856343.1 polysaccharide export outer membrane protein [Agrobacterium tum